MTTPLPWIRYWSPSGDEYPTDDLGFPVNPEQERAFWRQPPPLQFDEIAHRPCLVLLGDAGLGKTTALRDAYDTAVQGADSNHSHTVFKDLGTYEDQSFLVNDIFKAPSIQEWKTGNHILTLFLDSLDEGRIHIKTISKTLAEQLEQLPSDRLRLRIACRSTEWPETLTTSLGKLFRLRGGTPESDFMFHLVPLHTGNILHAANHAGVDAQDFLEKIHINDLIPLAIRPVTLQLLLNIYKNEGKLPSSKWEIYEKGCFLLCSDSQDRMDCGAQSKLYPHNKLDIAGHIFFLQFFSNKAFIWRGDPANFDTEQGLHLSHLENMPLPDGSIKNITRTELQDVFSTSGLFTRIGENRLAPAHQTYAEFLACRHLLRFPLKVDQLMGLLSGSDNHIPPQIQQLALWIAAKKDYVRDAIALTEPGLLLRGDISNESPKIKSQIIDNILKRIAKTRISHKQRWLDFGKLNHPEIETQILPWLEKKHCPEVRRTAMIIARQCNIANLSEQLATIALDQDDDYQVRIMAALTISDIGTEQSRKQLHPLAAGGGDDSRDELKGYALKSLWPAHMSTHELFQHLTPPQNEDFFGSYDYVITTIPENLPINDYPDALIWIARGFPHRDYRYIDTARNILKGACLHLNNDRISDAFLSCIYILICQRSEIFENNETKKHVLEALYNNTLIDKYTIEICRNHTEENQKPPYQHIKFLLSYEDTFIYIVNLHQQEQDQYIKKSLSALAARFYSRDNPQHTSIAFEKIAEHFDFALHFTWLLTPSNLESDASLNTKREYYEWNGRKSHKKRTKFLKITDKTFTDTYLNRGNNTHIWPVFCHLLNFRKGNETRASYFTDPLRNETWTSLTHETQDIICECAIEYINSHISTSTSALKITEALSVIFRHHKNSLDSIPDRILEKCADNIIRDEVYFFENLYNLRADILETFMRRIPTQTIATLKKFLDDNKPRHTKRTPGILRCFTMAWPTDLATLIAVQANDTGYTTTSRTEFLYLVLRHAPAIGQQTAIDIFCNSRNETTKCNHLAAAAASGIMRYAQTVDWKLIWHAIINDPEFSKLFFTYLLHREHTYEIRLSQLSEADLCNLYIHLFSQYPNREDPEYSGEITIRHEITDFKRLIISSMTQRGTPESITALQAIRAHHPDLDWIRYSIIDASDNTRSNLWTPYPPHELCRALLNSSTSFINNGDDLTRLIISKLTHIESNLHGHTPSIKFLWNDSELCTPKTENDFSDYIKLQLDSMLSESGIIFNREVEIRRHNKGIGYRVDIHADAIFQNNANTKNSRISLVIEVKCCWNQDLKKSMNDQLLKRYMQDSACTHGIYLIGWFFCDRWKPGDHQKTPAFKMSLEEARVFFSKQADTLSTDDKHISTYVMDLRLK